MAKVYQYIQDKGYENRHGDIDKIGKWTKTALGIWFNQMNKFK